MSVRVSLAPSKTSLNSKFGIPANFEKIRLEHLAKGTLYEDPTFPASDSSVFKKERPPCYPFQWARPTDIVKNPQLFVESTSRFDLMQGELGDCWVVAALAGISEYPNMVHRVVPVGQSFDQGWYAGMFVFRFWFFGKWKEVIIDDRLPTYKGRLIFIHSHQKDEFWGALVEKAYAKMIGCYEALRSGLIGDAMDDLTSGLTESMALDQKERLPPNLFHIILKAFLRHSLVGAGIKAKAGGKKVLTGNIMPNGLVSGHAYTVTDAKKINLVEGGGSQTVNLIRVRNPWGTDIEWKGKWSDNSREWNMISEQDRKAIGLVKADDGEFWMDFPDFLKNFTTLDICHLPPTLSVLSAKRWKCKEYFGAWIKGKNAGGRPFCRETHWMNPQYQIQLHDSEEDDNDTCTMLVALMQSDKRREGLENVSIGFAIYKASPKYTLPYPKEFFLYNRYVATCPYFVNARECVGRYELDEGSYIVVPCTYSPDTESKFLLRFFFENAGSHVNSAEKSSDATDAAKSSVSSGASVNSNGSNSPSAVYNSSTLSGTHSVFNNIPGPTVPVVPVRNVFNAVASGKDVVDAYQLVVILNKVVPTFQKWPINGEVGKSLVSLADRDDCFKLTFPEVEFLMHYIYAWLRTFNQIDTAQNGSIPPPALREVVAGMGYRVPDSLIRRFIHRFSNVNNRIPLSGYICCMAYIVKVMNIFNACSGGKSRAHLTLEEFFRAGLVI